MAQFFHPATNAVARLSIAGVVIGIGVLSWAGYAYNTSSYQIGVDEAIEQPIPFSHQHHVAGLGLDCRYCHTSVEKGPSAGMPPTKICWGCHQEIWKHSEMLEPVRRSFREQIPLEWVRVHDLADYVYFDHSIHVNKGVGCSTCHGRVDVMPLMWKNETLFMQWCLDCHRDPAPHIRPLDEVFNMGWEPSGSQPADPQVGDAPTNCSTCHR